MVENCIFIVYHHRL